MLKERRWIRRPEVALLSRPGHLGRDDRHTFLSELRKARKVSINTISIRRHACFDSVATALSSLSSPVVDHYWHAVSSALVSLDVA